MTQDGATRTVFVATVLVLLAPAAAQDEGAIVPPSNGAYNDHAGETAAALDLQAITWAPADGDVTVTLQESLATDAGLTAILYLGTEGDPEPDQAYILHTGPGGDQVLTVQDGETPTLTVDRSNRTVALHLDASWQPDCAFAVARTVTYPVGGQQVEDVIGWSGPDIEDAWNGGIACSQGQPVDAPATIAADVDTPAPSAFAALAAVVALASAMRRRNG